MKPWRTDPEWIDAQARYVADIAPDETTDQALVRRVRAATDMYEIEREHERRSCGDRQIARAEMSARWAP